MHYPLCVGKGSLGRAIEPFDGNHQKKPIALIN
ncbi:hypothetical protein EMIT0P44_310032 [Pseudomonas sp. IT-P44]